MKKHPTLFIYIFSILLLSLFIQVKIPAAQTDRGGGVPIESLPEELKGIAIKDYFIPSSFKEVGIIHALDNNAVVIHKATKEAYFGRQGDKIYENDTINTLDNSRCRVRLNNEDVITLAAETEFSVESYTDDVQEGKKSSLFNVAKGKAMFYAMRLFKYKEAKFDVKTPTAVVGVRGTKFGLHVYEKLGAGADLGLKVADAGRDIGPYMAQAAGAGPEIITVVTTGDGLVMANGVSVNPGEVYSTETNVVVFDPTVIASIEAETEVEVEVEEEAAAEEGKEEEAAEEEGAEEEEETVVDTGEEPAATADAGIAEETTDTTTQETGTSTEETVVTELTELTGPLYGYYAAPVTHHSTPSLQDVFVPDSLQETTGSNSEAIGINYPDNYIIYDDAGAGAFTYAMIDDGDTGNPGVDGPISVPISVRSVQGVKSNAYQWGYWDASTLKFPDTNPIFALDNRILWIEGYPTYSNYPDSWPSGYYKYNFDTRGTYWSSEGGIRLSGSGTCYVDFFSGGEGSVSEFKLHALSGDGLYGAQISKFDAVPVSGGEFFFSDYSQEDPGKYELREGSTLWVDAGWGQVSGTFFGQSSDIGLAWSVYHHENHLGAGGIGFGPGAVSTDISQGKTSGWVSGTMAAITDNANYGFAYFQRDASNNLTTGPVYLPNNPNTLTEGVLPTHVSYESEHSNEADQDSYKMVVEETSSENMDMKVSYFDWGSGANKVDNITPHIFTWMDGGSYSDEKGNKYLSWGWWEDPSSADIGLVGSDATRNFYAATGRIWEIEGNKTHPDYITYLQNNNMSATYSNPEGVKGVYVSSNSTGIYPTVLSGEVSFDVNFGNREILNFYIYASGQNGISIEMDGGTGTIDSDSEFDDIDFSTLLINGSPADGGGAGGIIAGPKANGAAGGWEIMSGEYGNEEWATGEFHTERGELFKNDISQGKIAEHVSGITSAITDSANGFAYFQRDAAYNITKGPIYEGGPNVLTEGQPNIHVARESNHHDTADKDSYKMEVQELSATNMDMNVTYFDWGSGTNYAGNVTPHTFTWNWVGSFNDENDSEYMSWGYWEDTSTTDKGLAGSDGTNKFYTALGRVYEVEGDKTHPDYITYLQNNNFSATYSNPDGVRGIYVSSSSVGTTPTEISGEVSFDVNFGSREVNNFHIYASGGSVNVEMSGGSGTIDSNSEFDIPEESFSLLSINGSPADGGGAGGVFTGAKANGAAGGWEIVKGGLNEEQWATGGFFTQRGALQQPQ